MIQQKSPAKIGAFLLETQLSAKKALPRISRIHEFVREMHKFLSGGSSQDSYWQSAGGAPGKKLLN
jgi:hypothetical protein